MKRESGRRLEAAISGPQAVRNIPNQGNDRGRNTSDCVAAAGRHLPETDPQSPTLGARGLFRMSGEEQKMGMKIARPRMALLSFFIGFAFLHPSVASSGPSAQGYRTVASAPLLEDLHALSLAKGDLDGDGIADLAAGFSDGLGQGRVALYRLPAKRIYPSPDYARTVVRC